MLQLRQPLQIGLRTHIYIFLELSSISLHFLSIRDIWFLEMFFVSSVVIMKIL